MIDTQEWLAQRAAGVPQALVDHLRVHARGGLTDAAVNMLGRALAVDVMTRAQALDVLGADALMTYALESAADQPDQLVARANAAMLRVAALTETVHGHE